MAVVRMLHPASDRVQRASRSAFERVWSAEGWVLLDEPKSVEPEDSEDEGVLEEHSLLEEPQELEALDRDELLDIVRDEGVKVDGRWGSERIAAAIADHRQ